MCFPDLFAALNRARCVHRQRLGSPRSIRALTASSPGAMQRSRIRIDAWRGTAPSSANVLVGPARWASRKWRSNCRGKPQIRQSATRRLRP